MGATIEVDESTLRALELAAHIANISVGQVVARLVNQASISRPSVRDTDTPPTPGGIAVTNTYRGHRTSGRYYPDTKRIEISSGPLAGRSFKTPSEAARAVIEQLNPAVNSNRNGKTFWRVDDGSERDLKSL